MVCIGYKSSWGVEMRNNQQRKDTLVEDVQRPTRSPSHLVFRTLDKSKDRRGSSRSLFGSLLQRASSFRSMNKKSPKQSSASELVDMDPKFTNVKFKFKQEVEKDTIIIPLHSPNDSPEELMVNDLDSNTTKAVVHVSYEPKNFKKETISTKTVSNDMAINQIKTPENLVDNVNINVNSTTQNVKNVNGNIENITEDSCKMTNNLVKSENSTLSPRLNRSPDPVHSANSNDTSPDSEVMSSLSIAATEEEKKKLFSHPNSVEEELPHVPTTLPLERSVAVPIVPVKHRITEVKTCSLDRPTRYNTPRNDDLPAGLGTYAIAAAFEDAPAITSKIQITLPKLKKQTAAADPPCKRRRACSEGRWVDFDDDDGDGDWKRGGGPVKPKSPKKITALPMSMRPRRGSSSANAPHRPNASRCRCDCHDGAGPLHDTWPATRHRSGTT